tara:strand:+ start:598 stop:942 length:345 start_codon:yes stop_codon:yes gene_type:complete
MNTYEVLLQRDNGYNKTVTVHDCYSEDEASLLAESQYGLPVLRVLWKRSTNNNTFSDDDYNSMASPLNRSFAGFMGGLGLLCVGAGVIILIEFWYLFVIGGVGYAGYKAYNNSK